MPAKNATQDFVQIRDIKDGIAILDSGQLCAILLATSVNFTLKSVEEQQAILAQFQAFLNTLDFSLQIYVQSRRLDIRPYIEMLRTKEADQYNDLMKIQLREYMEFIETFTNEVDIMSKNFFVVVPYTPGVTVSGITKFLGANKTKAGAFDSKKFAEDRSQLEQRITLVEEGLARTGIRTTMLGNDEVIELFYPEDLSKAPKQ